MKSQRVHTPRIRLLWSICVCWVALLGGADASAHTTGTSFLSLREQKDATIVADWDFDVRDLHFLLRLDQNLDGAVSWRELTQAQGMIEAEVLTRTRLGSANELCAVIAREPLALAEHGDGPYVRLTLTFACPGSGALLTLDHSGWIDFDSGHRALLEYQARDGSRSQTILTRSTPQWQVAESRASRLFRFFVEGARHLVAGYDHLAFLAVLLIALARRPRSGREIALRDMLKRAFVIITAFTMAHSLTLALAATGRLVLPSQPVEIAIAASVLLAALLSLRRDAGNHGWKLALGFGLVHGLGFAGALAELTSERIDLLALAAFNLGIEAAQLLVAAVAVPLLWWVFGSVNRERIGIPLASGSLAAVAALWVVARIGG